MSNTAWTDADPDTHRILVVDDNPSIHSDFLKILCPAQNRSTETLANLEEELFGAVAPTIRTKGRFEMDSAFQGEEALAKVKAAEQKGCPYSLAFVDVRMPPGWDGIETISRIWKDYPHIQVVICTAFSDYTWDQILRELGETDSLVILKKPFDNVEVLQLAHTLTKKWTVTRQANSRLADLDETVRRRTEELLGANEDLQREIQRRATIEAALRESEARFHQAFETVGVPLSIRPLESGGYLDVNQSFVQLCGYPKTEILGETPNSLNLIANPDQHGAIIQAVRSGRMVRNTELQIRRKDGEIREVLISIEILKLGDQSCLLAAIQDVTEQRKMEGLLRQSQKMEAIGQLAAGVAHDFNNLLTVIQGHSSLQLAKTNLDADVAKAFTQVKAASERAAALTRQLLAFGRQQILQCQPVNVGAAVARIKGLLSRTLGENIQLECQVAPNVPCVNADESNIDQIIMNLAVNARDAMPEGGKLAFSVEAVNVQANQVGVHPEKREGQFVRLTVKDTGCGMDQKTLNRIFEPFFTTKPIGRGTGLGLSTVYGIVKQNEGWIEVESQPAAGSTFRVFLPSILSSQGSSTPDLIREPVPSIPPEARPDDVIFVVEDEPEVRNFITSILSDAGYHVVEAATGADAILKWKDYGRNVRLLLTDMVMPGGISGVALARHLLRDKPALQVIYTSGYSPDVEANGDALKEGQNYLSKPFTQTSLLATVRNALHLKSSSPALKPVDSRV